MNQKEIYRIIDVNANRAREGLRVVEEVTRFFLKEPRFTACLKDIRHKITDALKGFSTEEFLFARNSQDDVGRKLYQPEESRRDSYREVIRANMVRSQEALRSLEEFSKIIDSRIGDKFKTLRFQLYSLEKEIETNLVVRDKGKIIKKWQLYLILDKELIGNRDPVEIVKAVAERGGVTAIQWRDKGGNTRETIKVVSQLQRCKELKNIDIIINDRVDIVQAAGADGVHLGQDDLSVSEARKLLGEKIIGISTHNEKEALEAEREGADYVSLGPIFLTQTKEDAGLPLGVKKLESVKRVINVPLVAIGGINNTNIKEVIAAGADVAAVASAVLKAKDITAATKELLSKFQTTGGRNV